MFLQNRSAHRILGRVTPEEAFTSKKLDVSHFWIFGTRVYCHVSKDSSKKLEPTTEKGIFVGYSETAQAYRVYLPRLGETVLRRDVRFQEDQALRDSLSVSELQYLRRSYSLPSMSHSQDQSEPQPGDKRVAQQDEERLGREQGATQPKTSNTGRKKAKWAKRLIQEAQK